MINLKKKNHKRKTEAFVDHFPIILLLQHNNLTVQEWFDFQSQLGQKKTALQFLTMKNSLLKGVLLNHSGSLYMDQKLHDKDKKKTIERLCQGPNVLIGCENSGELESIWRCLKTTTKCIFMSCFFEGKILNHLDVEILLKTHSTIYSTLLSHLDKKTELSSVLQTRLGLHPLLHPQRNLLGLLSLLKQSKA